jgi:predicted membrane protein
MRNITIIIVVFLAVGMLLKNNYYDKRNSSLFKLGNWLFWIGFILSVLDIIIICIDSVIN